MLTRTFTNDIAQILDEFRRSFNELFDNERLMTTEGSDWVFSPVVETGWTDDYLNLRVVLPGVAQQDFKVSVQGNQLVIEGERKAPENFGSDSSTFTRIPYGKFHRVVDLPNGLDLEKVSCNLHDGMLDIQIPVAESMKPRQIPVSSGAERMAIAA
jgi:HSP20 family protein